MAVRKRVGDRERLVARPPGKITGTWVSLPSRRVAYAIDGGPLYLDGVPGPSGEGARCVSFSFDGRHHAYYLQRGDKQILVIDGREHGAFTSLRVPPVWEGEHVACAARRGKKSWWIVVDGEPRFGPFVDRRDGWGGDVCTELVWTRRGLGYAVARGEERHFEIEGERIGEGFQHVHDLVLGLEPGSHAYRTRRDESWWMVWNGKTLGPFDRCEAPRFAHDGRLWFVVHGADRMTGRTYDARVYVGSDVLEKYPTVDRLVLARDAPIHALAIHDTAWLNPHKFVVHGALRRKDYQELFGLTITPDGAHVSAVAGDGKKDYLLLDDTVVATAAYIAPWDSVLSDDGAHVAYLANDEGFGKRGSRVRVDGKVESEPIDTLASGIVFAADGKSVSFIAEHRRRMSVYTLPTGA